MRGIKIKVKSLYGFRFLQKYILASLEQIRSNIVYLFSLSNASDIITHLNIITRENRVWDVIIKQQTTQFAKQFPLSFRSQSGSVPTAQWQDVLHSLSFLPRFGSGLTRVSLSQPVRHTTWHVQTGLAVISRLPTPGWTVVHSPSCFSQS